MSDKLIVIVDEDWDVTGDDLEERLAGAGRERLAKQGAKFAMPEVGGVIGDYMRWKFSHTPRENHATSQFGGETHVSRANQPGIA